MMLMGTFAVKEDFFVRFRITILYMIFCELLKHFKGQLSLITNNLSHEDSFSFICLGSSDEICLATPA